MVTRLLKIKKKKKEKKAKRNKQNPHDTGDASYAVEHVVEDNYPVPGPVVRFLRAEPLAGAAVSEEHLLL